MEPHRKVHYRLHESPPLAPILSQMHPSRNFPHYFPNIHSMILPSTSLSSKFPLPFSISGRNINTFLVCAMRAAFTAHLIYIVLITLKIFGEA